MLPSSWRKHISPSRGSIFAGKRTGSRAGQVSSLLERPAPRPALHEPTPSAPPGAPLRRPSNLPSSPDAAWEQPVRRPRTDRTGKPTAGADGARESTQTQGSNRSSPQARRRKRKLSSCLSPSEGNEKRRGGGKKEPVDGRLSGESRK